MQPKPLDARLKKKLGGNRLNSGFDPGNFKDSLLIKIAGYHIESVVREH